MQIKKIDFIFENCEYATFSQKELISFKMKEESKTNVKQCKNGTQRFEEKTRNAFEIIVSAKAKNAFRLLRTDVTHIYLEFEHGSPKHYSVQWLKKDASCFGNSDLQSVTHDSEDQIVWKSGDFNYFNRH